MFADKSDVARDILDMCPEDIEAKAHAVQFQIAALYERIKVLENKRESLMLLARFKQYQQGLLTIRDIRDYIG